MAYSKNTWTNNSSPPISGDNLNNIEIGIKEAHDSIDIINTKIDNLTTYSTTEVNTGKKWIDNKPIYRKVVDCGALPNSTSATIQHNITNLDKFTDISGHALRNSDNDYLPIPYCLFTSNNSGGISMYANEDAIYITTSSNRTAYNGYVILEYTKTTDEVMVNNE